MRKIYDGLGLEEEARELIGHYAREAVKALDQVSLTPEARDFFASLALKSAARSY